jgi:hypothetical protein
LPHAWGGIEGYTSLALPKFTNLAIPHVSVLISLFFYSLAGCDEEPSVEANPQIISWGKRKFVRVDLAIENLLNQAYTNPQGGAYLGQGPSMTTQGIPWGVVVPGRGRSFNFACLITY